MLNAFVLIPMIRIVFCLPFLLIAKINNNCNNIIYYYRKIQYLKYRAEYWESGGPWFNWKEFQKSKERRKIKYFYDVELPKKMFQASV